MSGAKIDLEALAHEIVRDVAEEQVQELDRPGDFVLFVFHPSSSEYAAVKAAPRGTHGVRDNGTVFVWMSREPAVGFARLTARESFADEIAASTDPTTFFVVTFGNGEGIALTDVECVTSADGETKGGDDGQQRRPN